ncbi:Uncharacterised protein [Salmonella enterica subsp. indica]|nr:Uncharacterised protein [Salmonella enterica subsp. indica]
MLGFVSALSSAVAVMILLMSVLLANLLSAAISKDAKLDFATLSFTSVEGEDKKNSIIPEPGQGFSLSATDLMSLASSNTTVRVYCTYGNNLSLDVAKKYTTYNYIVAKSILANSKIIVEQPVYEPKNKNNCIAEEIKK